MKSKITFFVLGAILATIAYFLGDMNDISAQNDTAVFDTVIVEGDLFVRKSARIKGIMLAEDGLVVRGFLTVEHKLPANKKNMVTIIADENGTTIGQHMEFSRGNPRSSLMKETNHSIWSVNNEFTGLTLGSFTGSSNIRLDDPQMYRIITPESNGSTLK